jgi:proteasome lid subunit RPN8/RPN11
MQNKTNLKKYEEHTLPENATIIVSQNLLNQVAYLHKVVGGVEWSGVLVYKTIEGSIEDYKNFVVEAVEVIPMDVGTSGYTEYEIESADEYVFKNLLERVMLDDKLKIGHIHTHHNMDCFFSGTDMSELHENAPNHNYYLSLIVNFQDYTSWKAKIAQIKTVKTKGSAVYSYKGTNGLVKEKVSINTEKEILSMINLDVKTEVTLEDDFISRVNQLKIEQDEFIKSRPVVGTTNWTGYGKRTHNNHAQPTLFDTLGESFNPTERLNIDVSSKNIAEFAWKLISQSNEPLGTLDNTLNILDKTFISSPGTSDLYVDGLIENFDLLFIDHFKTTPTLNSKKIVIDKIVEILEEKEMQNNYISTIIEDTIEALTIEILVDDSPGF